MSVEIQNTVPLDDASQPGLLEQLSQILMLATRKQLIPL